MFPINFSILSHEHHIAIHAAPIVNVERWLKQTEASQFMFHAIVHHLPVTCSAASRLGYS